MMTTNVNLKLVQNVALIKAAMPDLASWLEETNVYSGTQYRFVVPVNVSFSKSDTFKWNDTDIHL